MTEDFSKPDDDEFEVCIFGSGFGECILLHVGEGKWICVDSFKTESKNPVALEYLAKIGVLPEAIVRIVVTHWHADHIGGVEKVLDAATNAKLYITECFQDGDFGLAIEQFMIETGDEPMSSVHTITKVFEIIREKGIVFHFAGEDKQVYKGVVNGQSVEVMGLSPSSIAIMRCIADIKDIEKSEFVRDMPVVSPNTGSAALSVNLGNSRVLLAADLETHPSGNVGLNAIIQNHEGNPYKIVKIAHHGSPNGDCDELWETMVEDQNIAVVTPYNKGSHPRPDPQDVERIRSEAYSAHLTSPNHLKRFKSEDSFILKRMKRKSLELKDISYKGGDYVRMRVKAGENDWRVDHFGKAFSITETSFEA